MSGKRRRSQGEGSIYRRADGTWVGVLDLGYIEGRRRRKYVYAATEREVVTKLRQARRALDQGANLTAKVPTLAEWLTEWLVMKEAQGSRPLTLRGYRILVRQHLVPALGRRRVDQLTVAEVRRVIEAKSASGLSPATVRQIHGLLRNALGDAERHELITRNVAKAVRPPSAVREERRALTVAEARRLLEVIRGDRLEALWICALTLGLRRGELLGLRWEDIDTANAVVRVRQTVQRADGALRIVAPKTSFSRRAVPAPTVTIDALARHRRAQRETAALLGPEWPDTDLVFVSSTGTVLEPRNVDRQWHTIRDRAGLPWLRLHDLRHACATLLIASGASPRVVMQVLGHSQIALTMNTYAHVLHEVEREAMDALGRLLE